MNQTSQTDEPRSLAKLRPGHRIACVIGAFLCFGAACGGLAAIVLFPHPLALVIGAQQGVFYGAACAPVGAFCLSRKPLAKALGVIALVVIPIVLLTPVWVRWTPSLMIAFPVGALLVTTVVLRFQLKNEPLDDGRHCRFGYDLTGNVSGVCPECGRAVGSGGKQ